MKIFIDSADINEVKKYLSWGICQGVTTNPTICLKCGVAGGVEGIKKRTIEIAQLVYPLPVSAEVTSDNIEEIIAQAKEFSAWADNVVVKVTITDRQGNSLLPAIYELSCQGVSLNITAMTTFNQAILAARAIKSGMEKAKVKAKYNFISVFGGRISEEQGVDQASNVLRDLRRWLDFHKFEGIEIIVGSVRSSENVELWSKSGAHILTIAPEVLAKCLVSARTKETVSQFLNDAKTALEKLSG